MKKQIVFSFLSFIPLLWIISFFSYVLRAYIFNGFTELTSYYDENVLHFTIHKIITDILFISTILDIIIFTLIAIIKHKNQVFKKLDFILFSIGSLIFISIVFFNLFGLINWYID